MAFSIENQVLHSSTALIAHERLVKANNQAPEFVKIPLNMANKFGDMRILLKLLSGSKLEQYVNKDMTVLELKQIVEQIENIDIHTQRIIYAGK